VLDPIEFLGRDGLDILLDGLPVSLLGEGCRIDRFSGDEAKPFNSDFLTGAVLGDMDNPELCIKYSVLGCANRCDLLAAASCKNLAGTLIPLDDGCVLWEIPMPASWDPELLPDDTLSVSDDIR
jgi:hypothetical protein